MVIVEHLNFLRIILFLIALWSFNC